MQIVDQPNIKLFVEVRPQWMPFLKHLQSSWKIKTQNAMIRRKTHQEVIKWS